MPDSLRPPASPRNMTPTVSKTPPGSESPGYGAIVPRGTSFGGAWRHKGGEATPGRGPQLCHLVSIQVPWPGPAVGGLMARPMKRVIHQRAQTHAQDIQVTLLYEGQWVITYTYLEAWLGAPAMTAV